MTAARVVITGLGLVCPLGTGVSHCWSKLLSTFPNSLTSLSSPPKEGGEFKDWYPHAVSLENWPHSPKVVGLVARKGMGKFKSNRYFDPPELKRAAIFSQYAMAAAAEAIEDSGIYLQGQQEEMGVAVGSGMGSFEDIVGNSVLYYKDPRLVSPLMMPRMLINMAAAQIAIRYNCLGPLLAPATACASGLSAIGDAFTAIKYHRAKVMLAGGTEASVHPVALTGFRKARALSSIEDPLIASRPFDKNRDGFVLSEGAGVLLLEELNHAKNRGAKIYAEITGYGTSSDAYHLTAPSPNGKGAKLAMRSALKEAQVEPIRIDYVNAHATSTPLGDVAELRAIESLIPRAIPVSSNKGALGHLLGAAGAVETIFTALSVFEDLIPPNHNLEKAESTEMILPTEKLNTPVNVALNNSFGFGGINVSICLQKYKS